jgi:hypothetical protein
MNENGKLTMKTLKIGILVLATAVSLEAANLIGSDDFNDNSVDPAWTVFFADPGPAFTETNQRLEYTNPSGEKYIGWRWYGNVLSAAQDWAIEIDFAWLVDFGSLGAGQDADFQLGFETPTDGFGLKFIVDQFGFALLTQEFDIATDTTVFSDYQYIGTAASQITMRVSFDADTETFTSAYSTGGCFTTLTNRSVSSWGLSAADVLIPIIGIDNVNVPVAAGEAFADNFEIRCGTGSDDFNDNAVDPAWTVFFADAGPALTETNQRLEYTSPGGESYIGWNWNGAVLDPGQDWSAAIAFSWLVDFAALSPSQVADVQLTVATATDGFALKFIVDEFGFALLTQEQDIVADTGVFEHYQYLGTSSSQLTMRISYDAGTETMTSAYGMGGYYTTLTNRSISGWGLSEKNTLTPMIGIDNVNVPVAAGEAYADNLEIRWESPSLLCQTLAMDGGNALISYFANQRLYYELWGSTNLASLAWEGPLATVSGSNTTQQVTAPTAGQPMRYFQVRGFEMAPEPADFHAQMVGTTLPGTLTYLDSATRHTYDGTEPGDWSYTKTGLDSAKLVFTYDEDGNDPAVYREEIILFYTGKDTGSSRYSEFNSDVEDPGSVATDTFTF